MDNLKRVAADLGEEITDSEIKKVMLYADLDKDGKLSKEDFMKVMYKMKLY